MSSGKDIMSENHTLVGQNEATWRRWTLSSLEPPGAELLEERWTDALAMPVPWHLAPEALTVAEKGTVGHLGRTSAICGGWSCHSPGLSPLAGWPTRTSPHPVREVSDGNTLRGAWPLFRKHDSFQSRRARSPRCVTLTTLEGWFREWNLLLLSQNWNILINYWWMLTPKCDCVPFFIIVLLLYYLSSYPGDDGNLPFFHSEPILLLNDFSDIWVKEVIFSLFDEEKPQQIHHFNAPLTYYIKLCTIHFTYLHGALSFCS